MGKELRKTKKVKNFPKVLKEMEKKYKIRHKKLLIASLSVLALVILFFFLHSSLHMPAAVPAIM
jgi:Na+/H+ antiporter NhaD/arsenite permease-like protein